MRLYLYFAAGVVFTLWLSLEIFGAAGFVAFVVAMLCWQAAFHVRPTINAAFVAALIGYALTIAIWSVAFGPPQPGQHSPITTSVPVQ